MTNAEKFKEVFGFVLDMDSIVCCPSKEELPCCTGGCDCCYFHNWLDKEYRKIESVEDRYTEEFKEGYANMTGLKMIPINRIDYYNLPQEIKEAEVLWCIDDKTPNGAWKKYFYSEEVEE